MKKTLILLVVVLAFCGSVAADEAYANRQKIHPVGSEAYGIIVSLFIAQGHALPSSSGPWSADELILMLGKIDRARLAPGGKDAFDRATELLMAQPRTLFADGLAMQFGMKAALEGYFHTNAADFAGESDWVKGFGERSGLWKGSFETWATDSFYPAFPLVYS